MSLMAKEKNFAGIKAQVLVSMVADLSSFDTPSYKEFWDDKLTGGVDMEDMQDKYLQVWPVMAPPRVHCMQRTRALQEDVISYTWFTKCAVKQRLHESFDQASLAALLKVIAGK